MNNVQILDQHVARVHYGHKQDGTLNKLLVKFVIKTKLRRKLSLRNKRPLLLFTSLAVNVRC